MKLYLVPYYLQDNSGKYLQYPYLLTYNLPYYLQDNSGKYLQYPYLLT